MPNTRREPRTLHLTDPKQMRALAHPLRLRLLGLLRSDGPATATTLASRLDVSIPLASYHLRQLAEYGFLDEAPALARDGRERWWQTSHDRTSWSALEFLDTPERLAAESALGREIVRRYAEVIEHWLDERPAWARKWVDASELSDWMLELTPEELRRLRAEVAEVVERYADLERRDGTEQVHAIVNLVPRRRGPT
jgi:DNA-binding transcriptional ArsR family regulator